VKSPARNRAIAVAAGLVVGTVLGVAVAVVILVVAMLYGPAWAALAVQHGRFGASAVLALVTGAGACVWFAWSHAREHWNCTDDGCVANDGEGED